MRARRTTTSEVAHASVGRGFAPRPNESAAMPRYEERSAAGPMEAGTGLVGYDFLATEPVVIANVALDASGAAVLPRSAFGDATCVVVLVDDPAGVSLARAWLPEPGLAPREGRDGWGPNRWGDDANRGHSVLDALDHFRDCADGHTGAGFKQMARGCWY